MWDKRADTIVHESEPYNAEPDPLALAATELTALDTFYSRNHGPIPEVGDVGALVVDGEVAHQLRLSVADLQRSFETRRVTSTMQCAGNRRQGLIDVSDIPGEDPWRGAAIGTATWGGVRLKDVLLAAGAPASRDRLHVAFSAPDVTRIPSPPEPYRSSVPLAKAMQEEVLLAWEMNGEPLPRVHGGPLRVVVPAYVGARSVKWVDRVTVQSAPSDGYFQAVAYRILPPDADPDQAGPGDGISLGPWSLNSEILDPADGAHVAAGVAVVRGYAVAAEHRTVARVDVSADDGATWAPAQLLEQASRWTWRRWEARIELQPGTRTLLARAWDDSGAQQPSDPAVLWNPKGYANTSWARSRVTVG